MVGLVGGHLRVEAQGEVVVRLEEALEGAEEGEVPADLQEPLEEQGELPLLVVLSPISPSLVVLDLVFLALAAQVSVVPSSAAVQSLLGMVHLTLDGGV